MTWWQFALAGLFLKGAAALALVSLPDLAPVAAEPGADRAPVAVVVRCAPAVAVPGAPVVCAEIEPAR